MEYKQISKPCDRIREAIEAAGMTQAELVRKTDINRGALSSYLSGRYEPKQTALYKMGKALGVSEMWLAGYDVPKERTSTQMQADRISDAFDRVLADPIFRELFDKISGLSTEQVVLLSQLVDQITGTTMNK